MPRCKSARRHQNLRNINGHKPYFRSVVAKVPAVTNPIDLTGQHKCILHGGVMFSHVRELAHLATLMVKIGRPDVVVVVWMDPDLPRQHIHDEHTGMTGGCNAHVVIPMSPGARPGEQIE